jgi:hypothetical protein
MSACPEAHKLCGIIGIWLSIIILPFKPGLPASGEFAMPFTPFRYELTAMNYELFSHCWMIFVEPGFYVFALPGYCFAITGRIFFLTAI